MKHYYLSFFIATLMSMACTTASAHAIAIANSDGKTIYYNYNSNGSSVYVTYLGTSYSSYSNEYTGDVVIPETVTYGGKTYSVTSIGSYAFYGCSRLTSVTIPNSVTSIGWNAFYNCSGLTSVTIPNSVTSIGSSALYGCSGLKKVIVPNIDIKNWCSITFGSSSANPLSFAHHLYSDENTEITELVIPDSVTSIGSYAFYGCSGLTSVIIPNSVTSIGYYAFSGCSGLTSVTIPNSVTSIGSEAFYNTSIKSLTIGTDIQTMESNALRGIDKVIWLSNTPPSGYTNAGGTINYVPNDSYSGLSGQKIYPFLSSMFEVDGIKYVPVSPSERTCNAIDCVYNKSAENTKIDNTVTYKNVTMTVKNVGNYICSGNTYIKTLEYNFDGPIGSSAFSGCSGLTSVTIPNSVTSIGEDAFSDCSGLTSVTIPNSVTNIGQRAFSGCRGLTSVTIPNSVTSIGSSAFLFCSGLKKVIVPNFDIKNWCSIEFGDYSANPLQYAHHLYSDENTEITKLVIPDGVTSIGSSAFRNCRGLTSVTIPNSVTSIGVSAFYDCDGLTSVTIPNSVTSIGGYAFYDCDGLTSVTIPNSVTSIGSYAFQYCSGLASVTIGNSVTDIGSDAFNGCSGLTSVTWNAKNYPAFSSYSSNPFYGIRSRIKEFIIGDEMTSIPKYMCYEMSNLKSMTIPNSVTSIGASAFNGCSGLTSVRFENSKDNTPLTLGSNYVFSDCPLDEVYIGRKLSYTKTNSAGYSPFYKKNTLRSVKFTDKETEISDYEFYGCTNLTDVSMGDGVKSIGTYAFSGCSSLEQFTCGRQLESIGKEAFSDCTSMTKFRTRAAVPPTCGAQALDDINKWECTLYVPTESIDDYQAADQWKNFFFIEKFRVEGDSNGDDTVTMADANAVVNYFLAKGTDGFVEGDFDEEAADVNGDGEITMADANAIVNMFLNQEQ